MELDDAIILLAVTFVSLLVLNQVWGAVSTGVQGSAGAVQGGADWLGHALDFTGE